MSSLSCQSKRPSSAAILFRPGSPRDPALPSLRDAIMVVMKTQELAGIDVIADGELARFDINHPETNGMIEYFINKLDGIDTRLTRAELARFRAQQAMGFRARPAGIVRGPIGEGTLDLVASWNLVKHLTSLPLKFTVTSPYMLAKTLLDAHYGDLRSLTMAIADVLAQHVKEIDSAVLQVDEANLPGSPEDAIWAHEPINRVPLPPAGPRLCISASATMAVKQSRQAFGKISSNF